MQGAFESPLCKVSYFIFRAPARKVTALNPAPRKTSKEAEEVGSKSQADLQSWSHSLSGLMAESGDEENRPVVNLMTADASSDKVTSSFQLTRLAESALPDSSTVCQEISNLEENLAPLPDHSAQGVQRSATISSSPEKGAIGVYSAPISASVRDIVASKEEEGLMISGLEEVNLMRQKCKSINFNVF